LFKEVVVPECHGNAEEHCCYVAGEVCPYLEENTVSGRRWACGLLRRLGSWDAVNRSDEYRPIGETWVRVSKMPFNYCEAFNPRHCCREADLGKPDSAYDFMDGVPIMIEAP
jgi:hypothetical protein